MSQVTPDMTHRTVRNAQVGLAYYFLTGFFAVAILQGLGYMKFDLVSILKDALIMVLAYFFMRQRSSVSDNPTTPANPTPPEAPATKVTP